MQGLRDYPAGTYPVCRGKISYTHGFRRYVLDMPQCMIIEDVAYNVKMNWNTIKNIEKQYFQDHYSKPLLDGVFRIAIDEFAVLKGHVYMTVVLDLDCGGVLFVGKDRSKGSLDDFWLRVKRSGAQIKTVAMDIWPAYIGSVIAN